MQTIGVIGAGLMGNGIAHVAAQAGYDVVLSEISMDRAEAGKKTIEKNLGRAVAKGTIDEATMQAILGRIKLTTDTGDFANADLVIEAATENEAVKTKIFHEHLVDLDHAPGCLDRPPRPFRRPALLQPGAGDEALGNHSGPADLGRNQGRRA